MTRGEPAGILTFDGLVLATYPSGERDLVLHILADPGGTISVLQKGGRTPKKGRPRLEPFDGARFSVRSYPSSLLVLKDFSPGRAYPGLRDHVARLTTAALLVETLQRIVPPEEPHSRQLLQITLEALTDLDLAPDTRSALKALHQTLFRLLVELGYMSRAEDMPVSKHGLMRLVGMVEEQISRELLTKGEVLKLCERLG